MMEEKKCYFLWAWLILCFTLYYSATRMFPLCSDDFSYSYIYGSSIRVESIHDILISQWKHYLGWSGRFWTHCVVQYILMYDKIVFDCLNVVVYALCTYIVAKTLPGERSLLKWCIVASLFWLMMPHTGSSMFWLTGSVNYLWASLVNIAFFYVIINEKRNLYALSIPLALIAGNAHEGISVGGMVTLIFLSVILKRKKLFYYFLIALYIIGVMLNLLSPGNFVRASISLGEGSSIISFLIKLCISFVKFMSSVCKVGDIGLSASFFVFLFTWVVVIVKMKRKSKGWEKTLCFLLGGLTACLFSFASGAIYARAFYGFCFFSFLSFFTLLLTCWFNEKNTYVMLFICALLFVNVFEIPKAYFSIKALSQMVELVKKSSCDGDYCVAYTPEFLEADSRYMEKFGLSGNAKDSRPLARYYGGSEVSLMPEEIVGLLREEMVEIAKLSDYDCLRLCRTVCVCKLVDEVKTIKMSGAPQSFYEKFRWFQSIRKYYPRKDFVRIPMIVRLHGGYYAIGAFENEEQRFQLCKKNGEIIVLDLVGI